MKILLQVHYSECNFDFTWGSIPNNDELIRTFGRKIFFIEELNERFLFINSVTKRRIGIGDCTKKETNMKLKLLFFNKDGDLDKKFESFKKVLKENYDIKDDESDN